MCTPTLDVAIPYWDDVREEDDIANEVHKPQPGETLQLLTSIHMQCTYTVCIVYVHICTCTCNMFLNGKLHYTVYTCTVIEEKAVYAATNSTK